MVKRDDFKFHIANFPFICSNIQAAPAYGVYIYTPSEKPVNDQSHGMLDRYGITILYK